MRSEVINATRWSRVTVTLLYKKNARLGMLAILHLFLEPMNMKFMIKLFVFKSSLL